MSLVKNAEFLGGSSKIHSARDGSLSGFYSMPVKVEFKNKGARIHFVRTLHKKCDIGPSISLPTGIRKAQTAFYNELKHKYNDYNNYRIVPTSAASHGQATGGAHGGGDTHEEQLKY